MASDAAVWAGLGAAAVVLTVLGVIALEYGEQADATVQRGAATTAARRTFGHPLVFVLLVIGLFAALGLAIVVLGV